MKFNSMIIVAIAAMMSVPAHAEVDTPSAVAGAAVGAVATTLVKGPNGTTLDCGALDISKMSDQDIINVRKACDSVKAQTPEATLKPEDVREWANLAQDFGTAVGSTARELGIAVNDFLMTPAGILLTVYLFWSKLGGIFIGIPFIILIWTVYLRFISNYKKTPTKFEVRPVLYGLFNKKYAIEFQTESNESVVTVSLITGAIMTAITAGIIGVLIF